MNYREIFSLMLISISQIFLWKYILVLVFIVISLFSNDTMQFDYANQNHYDHLWMLAVGLALLGVGLWQFLSHRNRSINPLL